MTVHPRSRGEHLTRPLITWLLLGSSPLARGTHVSAGRGADQGRFIPARAGNTRAGCGCWCRGPVHPRSRGEHRRIRPETAMDDGSSPLARGTRARPRAPGRARRFIPARAGNTVGSCGCCTASPVHPRSRGEHGCGRDRSRRRPGSSPLARGTPDRQRADALGVRFIPARAGNTRCATATRPAHPVHPRSRGEHSAT